MIASGSEGGDPLLGPVESLVAIAILIGLSGFFAGSETALTGVSKSRMYTLAKEGDRKAALVNRIREKKDDMIGALMLGNTAVHVMASALAANALIGLFGEAGVFYASAVMTILVLIFGEVLPKTYALYRADSMAMAIAPLIHVMIRLLVPVTAMITFVVRVLLRIMGADMSMVSSGHHLEALRGAIELHQGPEEEVQQQRAMLRSILDLADVDVGEIMTHRKDVETLDIGQPVEKVVDEILKSTHTRIPIWRETPDNIVGVIHAKTLLKEIQHRGGKMAGIDLEHLAAEPWYVPESTTLFDQLQEFRQRREHFALVVDEYGALMGVVTLEDVLEEIVGEIEDETDEIVAGVRKLPGGVHLVDGDVTIRDLNREFEWGLPDENYSTLAGLILHESKMIPEAGQSFNFFGFRFDILRRQRNQITLIRVIPPQKKKKDGKGKSAAA